MLMSAPDKNSVSLWEASAEEQPVHSPMTGDINTEVAIVGGGFTGLSTALHLAQQGIRAHVLEAQTIGYGGSGRNVGLVNAGLWLPPRDITARLGESRGAELTRRLAEAPEYVFSLIDKHRIQCEAMRRGTIHAAHSPKGYQELQRRAEQWNRLGAPVELLDREAAAEKTGTSAFYGGLLDHRAGVINPMGYVRGLGRAAMAAGAVVNTGIAAGKLRREAGRWHLETASGSVAADSVVLATNAYTGDLWPELKRCFTMIHYFQVATEPLGERAARVLPGGHGLWTTGAIMLSLRRDRFGRIIIGSMGRVIGGARGGSGDISAKWAKRNLRHLFPDLGEVELETAWHGQIAMTPDHLPRIYRLAEDLYTPIGYNGRGIGPGTVFGMAMAGFLAGGDESQLPLPVTALKTAPGARIKSRLYDAAFTANQMVKNTVAGR